MHFSLMLVVADLWLTYSQQTTPGFDWTPSPPTVIQAVAIISRHGDRTPIYTHPDDPHPKDDKGEWPEGQLTARGRQRVMLLGQYIRIAYRDMFMDDPMEIEAKSASHQRNIDSAKIFVTSVNPLSSAKVTVANEMLTDPSSCKAAELIFDKLFLMKEVTDFKMKHFKLLEVLSKHTGEKIESIQAAYELFDTLKVFKENGKSLPDWVTEETFKSLEGLSQTYFCIGSSSTQLQKLLIGLFYSDMKKGFEEKISGKSNHRLLSYNTADTKMDLLLRTLNAFDKESPPPYAASVIFELHQNVLTSQHFLKSYYLKDILQPKETVAPKTCVKGKLCDFNNFFEGLKDFLIDDFDKSCKETEPLPDKLDNFLNCFE